MPQHRVLTDELLAAALGPEPRPDLRARAPRFFHADRFERLVRAHPASPYILYLPLFALCCWRAGAALELPAMLGLLLAGWLVWTFVEYWLHRGFFHLPPTSPARSVTSFIVHRHHHVAPRDRDHLVATPIYSLGLFLLLLAASSLAGAGARWALLAGSMLGYLAYEAAHWHIHHARPRGPLGRALHRHHLRHHFGDAGHNFGISSPLWDLVFCTWRRGPVPEDSSSTAP
ncbi:MAG: sterol desaturase family protein [Nannocystis sp.]|nr:sterol desaturase family protein [Nannocystis sp.]MBA3547474.1 sterol desaturase family protein [Nannocystis sp.]